MRALPLDWLLDMERGRVLALVDDHTKGLGVVSVHIVAASLLLRIVLDYIVFEHSFPQGKGNTLDELLLVNEESPSGVLLHDHLLHRRRHADDGDAQWVLAARNNAWVGHDGEEHGGDGGQGGHYVEDVY